MEVQIKINEGDDDLFCTYSKERIPIGSRYALVSEEIYDDVIVKSPYTLENIPESEEEYYEN